MKLSNTENVGTIKWLSLKDFVDCLQVGTLQLLFNQRGLI